MAFAAALLLATLGDGPLESRSIAGNHTASVLVERAPALGIDFDPNSKEDSEGNRPAIGGAGAWLDEQLKVADDSIGEPPAELRTFLEDHRDALAAIVGTLETDSPEWKEVASEEHPAPDLRPSIRLHRVLLAGALVAVRRGDSLEAERLVEASWSLSRPNEESSQFIRQIVAIAAGRQQAGVLRKLPSVSPVWIGRLSEAKSWEAVIDAFSADRAQRKSDTSLATDSWEDAEWKALDSVLARLRKLGPCEGTNLGDDGLWKLLERELPITSDEELKEQRRILWSIMLPNMLNAFQRAGRLAVDQELTLEILRLRQAQEQDAEKRWPERMANSTSTVCPAFGYMYRSDSSGMEIRFDGTLVDPAMGLILPLTFRSAPPPPPTPTKTPTPSPQ